MTFVLFWKDSSRVAKQFWKEHEWRQGRAINTPSPRNHDWSSNTLS